MASTVMMYVLPMMLGQTYHMGKDKPGIQIFPTNATENAVVMRYYFTDSQYRLAEDVSQVKDFLDISGKLSLKVKSGMIEVSGEGSYVKEMSTYDNVLQILIKVHFETITKTIPSYVTPLSDWQKFNPDFLGTHYVRSVTMGGDLIASIKVTAKNEYDMERIKGAVMGGVKTKGRSFEASVKARLEKLRNDTQDSASMEINYWATVPLEGVTYTTDGLLKLVREFPDHVRKVNGGLGNALRMELFPLKALNTDYKEYIENRALGETLDDMDYQFDDILATRKAFAMWIVGLPPVIPDNIKTKIEEFNNKIDSLYGIYLNAIDEMNVSINASTKPIEDAIQAYEDGKGSMPQKYLRKLKRLQQDIYKEAPELQPRIGGAHYIHWGRSKCDGPGTDTAVSGVMTASQDGQNGGSSEFICAPLDPEKPDPTRYFPNIDPEDEDLLLGNLLVNPIKYAGEMKQFDSMTFKQVTCATCRSPHRTALLVKPGDSQCPGNWTKEYDGLLMAPGIDENKGEFVCMDWNMQPPPDNAKFGTADGFHTYQIQEVSVQCGSLPCGPYAADKIIPCVVCTI